MAHRRGAEPAGDGRAHRQCELVFRLTPLVLLVEPHRNLAMNEIDAAMHESEKILELLSEGSPLDRTDEPLRVYHAVYLLLKKMQDPRSKRVLQKAKNLLDIQISNFKDDSSQRRYIDSMPWRRAIHDEML